MWSRAVGQLAEVVVPGDDGEPARQAAVGDGDARGRRHRDRAGDARHDLDRDAGRLARLQLLAAAAEHVRVAALEPHHTSARERVPHQLGLDLVLRPRVVAGGLADVDHDHVGLQLVEHAARAEAVDDHDVGGGEQGAAAGGQQVGGTGAAADQRHPAGAAPGSARAQREGAVGQAGADGVADRLGAARVAVAVDGDRDRAVGRADAGDGRHLRGAGGALPGVDAQHPQGLGVGAHGRVGGRVAGGGVDEPGAVEVGGTGVVARQPADRPGGGQLAQRPRRPTARRR